MASGHLVGGALAQNTAEVQTVSGPEPVRLDNAAAVHVESAVGLLLSAALEPVRLSERGRRVRGRDQHLHVHIRCCEELQFEANRLSEVRRLSSLFDTGHSVQRGHRECGRVLGRREQQAPLLRGAEGLEAQGE